MRRIFVPQPLHAGEIPLADDQAHHVRRVLRLKTGDAVELFDAAGNVADAIIRQCDERGVIVQAGEPKLIATENACRLVVAAAVPKGERADWMVEKLSEIGVDELIPLRTERGVVLPAGQNKLQRWDRIASESAKQSRRAGVMRIANLTDLANAVQSGGWCLSPGGTPIGQMLRDVPPPQKLTLFIGPEGGWSDSEIVLFTQRGIAMVSLTPSILRVETAAIVAAAMVRLSILPPATKI